MARPIDLFTGLDLEDVQTVLELSESEDFSTLIANSSMDGILTYDIHARYTLWNPAMERITGLKKEAVLGRCAFEVFPFLKEVGLDRVFYEALNGKAGKIEAVPYTIPETGCQGFTENFHSPLRDELGNIVGGLAIVRDITGSKKLIDGLRAKIAELERAILPS